MDARYLVSGHNDRDAMPTPVSNPGAQGLMEVLRDLHGPDVSQILAKCSVTGHFIALLAKQRFACQLYLECFLKGFSVVQGASYS